LVFTVHCFVVLFLIKTFRKQEFDLSLCAFVALLGEAPLLPLAKAALLILNFKSGRAFGAPACFNSKKKN